MDGNLQQLFFISAILLFFVSSGHALSCTVDNECLPLHTTLCQNFTCLDGTCVQSDYYCPNTPPGPCFALPGVCSLLDGICYYPNYDCSDDDVCTFDSCITNDVDPMWPVCIHESIPNCVSNASHTVTFSVDDVNVLDVYAFPDTDIIQLCHLSTYHGPNSVQLLSFTPYEACTLNQRGTCDNHPNQDDIIEAYTLAAATDSTPFPCTSSPPYFYALAIGGVSGDFFVWDQTPLPPTLTQNEAVGSLHIHGYIHSVADPTLILMVDIKISHPMKGTYNDPYLNMDQGCYITTVDPFTWVYFQVWSGTLTATADSAYFGLVIELSSSAEPPQLGFGANGVNSNYGLFAKFTWTIIAQPLDTLLHLNTYNTFAQLVLDVTPMLIEENPYCDLFGEPQIEAVNGWTATILGPDELIQYCANFTMHDLLSCRNATDPYTSLFGYSRQGEESVEYIGQLYSTTLIPTTCGVEGEVCAGEEIVGSASFNLSLSIMTQGRTEMRFTTAYTNFQVYWINNVWMCGANRGNLKVNIRTRILDTGPNTGQYLCNPRLDLLQETGYALSFTDPLAPECEQIGDYCYQDWVLRTYDATNVVDFSGYKPLVWDICVSSVVTQTVSVGMNLWAYHVGDQSHTDAGDVTATFNLYEDRIFTTLYSGGPLAPGSDVYGLICLNNYHHLDIHVKRVYICYSTEADIAPFDPLNPGITGCNTPGINVQEKMIYSADYADYALLTDPRAYRYAEVYSPPSTADCEGFVFKPKPVTNYTQSIQIVWCAQENGGAGAMIELLTETSHHYSRHVDENEASSDILFTVECDPGYHYDETLLICVLDSHGHHDDDDDDVDLDGSGAAWVLLFLISILLFCFMFCFSGMIRHRLFWSQDKIRTDEPKTSPKPIEERQQQPAPKRKSVRFSNAIKFF